MKPAAVFAPVNVLAASFLVVLLSGCNKAADQAQADLTTLAPVATDDIAKNPALLSLAMTSGKTLYDTHCASCHGADLKGLSDHNTPNLTDNEWIYTGDDVDSGGVVHKASDVEKTILNGIRAKPKATNLATQQENDTQNMPFKNLAEMPAMGPPSVYALNDNDIADAAEYVLQLGGQEHNKDMAVRGEAIFNGKGSCYDCHQQDGAGDQALGSANLTKPMLYLYGSSREAILATLKNGRAGISPAFAGKLKPEEAKAVAVYVFSQGGAGTL